MEFPLFDEDDTPDEHEPTEEEWIDEMRNLAWLMEKLLAAPRRRLSVYQVDIELDQEDLEGAGVYSPGLEGNPGFKNGKGPHPLPPLPFGKLRAGSCQAEGESIENVIDHRVAGGLFSVMKKLHPSC